MASKNIMKFILKMAVVALIIAGIVYAIIKMTSPKTSQNDIINSSNRFDIAEKYSQSYGNDFVVYANGTTNANKLRIVFTNKINDFLLEYYDYYLTLTLFQNQEQNADKEQIQNLMKSLSTQIDNTLEIARLTKVDGLPDNERQRRLANYATEYFRQTKIFFELNERLKAYVYKVNYNSNSTGIVYESQLEMVKDYCKVAFENNIFEKYNQTGTVEILSAGTESSFSRILEKFNARQTDNKNGDKEAKFVKRYMSLDKQTLEGFYKAVGEDNIGGKQDYINSITDDTVKVSLTSLFDYIKQVQY